MLNGATSECQEEVKEETEKGADIAKVAEAATEEDPAASQVKEEEKQAATNDAEEAVVKEVEPGKVSAADLAEAYLEKLNLGELKAEEVQDNTEAKPRPDAIVVSGAIKLERSHFVELLEAKQLPKLVKIEHIKKSEVVLVFASPAEASAVLSALTAEDAWEDVDFGTGEGPAIWRARNMLLAYGQATTKDVMPEKVKKPAPAKPKPKPAPPSKKEVRQEPDEGEPMMRLRINGDPAEVSRARVAVMGLLPEFYKPGGVVEPQSEMDKARARVASLRLPTGHIREFVKVLSTKVGLIIGKKGETIKQMESETGARLRVVPKPEGEQPEAQEVMVQGPEAAIDKAMEWLSAYMVEPVRERSPRGDSPPPTRRRARQDNDWDEDAPREHRRTPAGDGAVAAIRRLAEMEEARASGRSVHHEEVRMPYITKQELLEQKAREMDEKEVELYLKRQEQLDEAAAQAEAAAADLAAIASKLPEVSGEMSPEALRSMLLDSDGLSHDARALHGPSNYEEWQDESQDSPFMGKICMTPYGPGRISKVSLLMSYLSYFTVDLFTGGSVQAVEQVAKKWMDAVKQWLGTCVLKPTAGSQAAAPPAAAASGGGGGSWVQNWDNVKARLLASGCGLVVSEAVEEKGKLAYKLVPHDGPNAPLRPTGKARADSLVDADALAAWPRIEPVFYLVELCTTPKKVGHVAAFRHDYRTFPGSFTKGDMVVVESARPGTRDVGVILKVLTGAKAEAAAASAAPSSLASARPMSAASLEGVPILRLKRVLRRCTEEEKKRRQGSLSAVEAAALPLLSARLPPGAEALGVGSSLDGLHMRLFVKLPDSEGSDGARMAVSTATIAASLGALLGCTTELLVSRAPAPAPAAAKPPEVIAPQAPTGDATTAGADVAAATAATEASAAATAAVVAAPAVADTSNQVVPAEDTTKRQRSDEPPVEEAAEKLEDKKAKKAKRTNDEKEVSLSESE
eukprot:TRINITY_DN29544_c0_g2_i1.p1 TRINITY_DN29544_c0_g2~~TRINITY_DN29544_c0_g2_i1.p1  ORF type:complete len:969 (-),score=269.09 TRINITY_DN29544_c0_g2_i1:95-3001(-)